MRYPHLSTFKASTSVALAVIGIALALSACGDDDPSPADPDTSGDTGTDLGDVGNDSTDNNPPTVSLDTPADGACVTGTAALEASASDDGWIVSVEFFAGDTSVGEATNGPFTVDWDTSNADEGTVALRAVATDDFGDSAEDGISVVVDRTDPAVTIDSPAEGDEPASGTLEVSLTIADDGGVASVEVQLGAEADGIDPVVLTGEPWTAEFDVSGLEGEYGVTATATDCAGLTGSAETTVTIAGANCDVDEDGVLSIECGGTDCDDNDDEVTSNACGGCEELEGVPDEACGTCDSGVWTCAEAGGLDCVGDAGDDALNDCGSCGVLAGHPGDECTRCDGEWCAFFCTDTGEAECLGAPQGFARIHSGTFMMGSPEGELGRGDDEGQHQVTITRPFFIGTHEVTQAEWRELIGNNPSEFGDCDDCPVEGVTFWDAAYYANEYTIRAGEEPCYELIDCTGEPGFEFECAAVDFHEDTPYDCHGFRLPTEAEWEWAARAETTEATYVGELDAVDCTSEPLEDIAWFCGNSEQPQPVGSLTPNEWGLYDMLGNVFEWTSDWYAPYPEGAVTDPWGDSAVTPRRVTRGGAWDFSADASRAATRGPETEDTASDHVGFRLAQTAPHEVPPGFVLVEPGTFTMGSPEGELGRGEDEGQFEVTLHEGFYIAQYEVTQLEWRELIGNNPSELGGCNDCPVEGVTFWDAATYANELSILAGLEPCYELIGCTGDAGFELECDAVDVYEDTVYECEGFRLPTEAEWEFAARAGTTEATYNGDLDAVGCDSDVVDPISWYCGNSEQTEPRGTLAPNPWGIYDMLGNVFEWTTDYYEEYPTEPVEDRWVTSGTDRVTRGGAWDFSADASRAARRGPETEDTRSDHVGIRIVQTAHEGGHDHDHDHD